MKNFWSRFSWKSKRRTFWGSGVFVDFLLLYFGLTGSDATFASIQKQEVNLDYRAEGFPPELRDLLAHGLINAHSTAQGCLQLARERPQIQKAVLDIFENKEITFVFDPDDKTNNDVCAYTRSYGGLVHRIHLNRMAFTGKCYSLSSTIFHETMHLASFFLSESEIQEIQLHCLAFIGPDESPTPME
ncbi:hypothetical protein WDW86_04475 [Bdellovibrionota bacterium FG-2]